MERLDVMILDSLRARHGQDVFWWEGRWLKAEELIDMIEASRRALEAAGFKEGQRIMTLLPNCPALFCLATAIWSLNGTLVPLNMRAGVGNLLPTIELVEPFAIVISRGDFEACDGVKGYPIVQIDVDGSLDSFSAEPRKETNPDWAVFYATSGTTGMPKAVPISHSNFMSNIDSISHHIDLRETDTLSWVLPNFHSFGLTLSLMLPPFLKAKVAAVASFMPPTKALQAIIDAHCSVLFMVPTMVEFLKRAAAHVGIKKVDGVRMVITGGDRLNTMLDHASMELFGCPILEGYGTTECSPVVAVNSSYERRKLGTIGTVMPGYDWKVCDQDGNSLPPNTPGVLVLRGGSVFGGYYGAPEATAERFRFGDGWYDTSDVVTYDEDGFITVLDRLNDIIIVGGFNVYPQEVERVINEIPSVASSAVVAMRHSVNGEIPRAFIVLKDGAGSLTEREIIDYCKSKLAGYKVPRKIDFVESLPLSASGKVLRRKLREMK